MLLQTTPCSSCSNASKRLWLSPFSPPDVAVGRKYADSAMVHVQTRSLANMLTKAAATRLENGKGEVVKGMANASALARLAQQASQYQERPRALLASFKEAVGVKAALAFMVDLPLNLSHLIHAARPPDDDPAMCDAEREQSIFNDVFTAQGFAPIDVCGSCCKTSQLSSCRSTSSSMRHKEFTLNAFVSRLIS